MGRTARLALMSRRTFCPCDFLIFGLTALFAALPNFSAQAAQTSNLKPPAAFVARAVSASTIQLKWRDTNSVETGYLLEYRKGSGAFRKLAQLPRNSAAYTHRNLVGGTSYTYRLSATQKKKLSLSRIATATTPAGATPTPTPTPTPVAETVATPVIAPAAGTYTDNVQVTISTATAGATIRYTTNGIDPTAASPAYTTALNLTTTTTIKARAFKSGLNDSAIAMAVYTITITPTVSPPAFAPAAGTFIDAVQVTMSTPTSGAVIRYTLDGSTPTAASSLYGGGLTFFGTTTLKARAFKAGSNDSSVTTATYTIAAAAPVLSPTPGTFANSASVTMSSTTAGATIRYTTNGADPTAASTLYTGAVALTTTTTLKARAFKTGLSDSAVTTGAYTITVTPTVATPVIAPAAGTYTDSVNATITCATANAEIHYTLDGSTPSAASAVYTASIPIPIPITSTTTLKAIGIKAGSNNSSVATSTFTIVSSSLHPKLSARPESSSSIRLNWLNTASNQASGLTIQRSPDGGESTAYANIATTATGATTYLNTGLTAGKIHYFRARATGSADEWSYATAVTNPTGTAQPPNPPTGLTVTAVATNAEPGFTFAAQVLKIVWTRNATGSTDTSYIIERSSDGQDFQLYADVPTATLFPSSMTGTLRWLYDEDLPANTKYYYRVRAKGTPGVSAATDIVSAVTFSTNAPGAPMNFTAQTAGPNTINLTWQNSAPIDGWRIYMNTGNNAPVLTPPTINDSVTGASGTIIQPVIQLTANTKYNFQIDTFRNVNGTPQFSTKTTVASATTTAATGVQITNQSAYPIISLKIDNVERFTASPQSIPAGTSASPARFTVALADGTHTYSAQNGFWDGNSRNTLYSYSGSFTVSGGASANAPVFNAPTIAQLMTQLRGTTGTWSGWYAGGSGFIPVKVRFLANGSCTLSYSPNGGNYTTLGSGTYAMQTNGYQGTFVANFNIVLTSGTVTGTFAAKLSETGGWFGATFPGLSPYAIQFNADGP
jgi:hypothetical protein